MTDQKTIIPTITDVGMNALINAQQKGIALVIDHVSLGTGLHQPSKLDTQLLKPFKDTPVVSVQDIALGEIRSTIVDSSNDRYSVTEVGFMTKDNVLFAIWSTDDAANPLLQKTPVSQLTVPYNIAISGQPQITITSTGQSVYPQATPDKQGVIQLATETEALNKGNTEHAITPETLNHVINILRQPQTFYVDNQDGDDAADGSEDHPVTTIDQAVKLCSSMSERNFVYLKGAQTHTVQTQLPVENKYIVFRSWGDNAAVIANQQVTNDRASGFIPTGGSVLSFYNIDFITADLPDSVNWSGMVTRYDDQAGTVKTYQCNVTCQSAFIQIPSGPGIINIAMYGGAIKYNPTGKRPNVIINEAAHPVYAHITSSFQDLNGNSIDSTLLRKTIFSERAFNKNASSSQQPFNILSNIDLSQGA
ncbi:phage tail-collar fiber domain-containing protein [Piscirickettsia litoralis]|uniref:Phage tail fibre protein N-terminal domain-containing protein n=1 Tax=Piscirickettsia litoralis TaxID=1891921 RepID=A0ABX2ZX79_9GAMM|nr:phage tail protein [Piscirickettsia litoralis]ODN41162.1 hypothetical protein BGC07_17975 [Piscirickettsia litoralis]